MLRVWGFSSLQLYGYRCCDSRTALVLLLGYMPAWLGLPNMVKWVA